MKEDSEKKFTLIWMDYDETEDINFCSDYETFGTREEAEEYRKKHCTGESSVGAYIIEGKILQSWD